MTGVSDSAEVTVAEREVLELKPIEEIVLEPLHSKGLLVDGEWWQPDPVEPVSFWRRNFLFFVTILLPITASIIYFGFLTGDQYVSEAHFLVRTSSHEEFGNLAALMQNQKLSRAADETYALTDYMTSRDAMNLVSRTGLLQRILSRPDAGPFERFPGPLIRNDEENLYRRFKDHVKTTIDGESGISELKVYAFTPADAEQLATALLAGGEQLINRLNTRAHDDALAYANKNVATAKTRLVEVENSLERFRNNNRIIAPDKEASLSLQSLTKMRSALAELQANLRQKMALTPRSPALASMREQIKASQAEIDRLNKGIAGDHGSMAGKLGEFEKLTLDRTLAAKGLEASTVMLESAERDARQQQLYIETIVAPGVPDQALYPYRLLFILISIVCAFTMRWFLSALGRTVLEHRA